MIITTYSNGLHQRDADGLKFIITGKIDFVGILLRSFAEKMMAP